MLNLSHAFTIIGGAAVAAALFGASPVLSQRAAPSGLIGNCRVVDGDTLRCGRERIRLLGIDAPELPGHCQPGRRCAPGNSAASTRSLEAALVPPLRINRVGTDHYGRTLALVHGGKGDLSCWQLTRRQAIYKPRWDEGQRLRTTCPAAR